MAGPRIGVVGGYGQVGRAAAEHLRRWHSGPLRIGGRDADRAARLAERLSQRLSQRPADGPGDGPADGPDGVEARVVDVTDPTSLADFCAGCDTVVNCAGPARDIGDAVARAALAAGTGYVDAAGDDPLHTALRDLPWTGPRAAVVSAGMMPGLTGLLPRLLARDGFTKVDALHGYVGGRDTFTHTAAVDYLGAARTGYGEPLAAWRGGVRAHRALTPASGVRLRYFPDPVGLQPYLSTETERLAGTLGLSDVDWYSVFVGDRVAEVLGRRTAEVLGRRTADGTAASALCRAAELDAFGHDRYQIMVFTLTGNLDGEPRTRTLVCRATGASALTGAATALTAVAVAEGLMAPGVHHLADALDPAWAARKLRTSPTVTAFEHVDGDGTDEEGTL